LDQYHIDNYVSFGDEWDNRVRDLFKAGEPVNIIAASLDIDKRTLVSQLVRLGLLKRSQPTSNQSKAAKTTH
jgi:hypothetical protein